MIYQILYSRSTAALLALASGAALAMSQTRTIVDAVTMVHPAWHPAWHWTAAVGFETAILAVGLVMAASGDRGLWRWELVLVAVSVLAGFLVAMAGHDWTDRVALARAVATGIMPVQYLAVVMCAHRLAGRPDRVRTDVHVDDHARPVVQTAPRRTSRPRTTTRRATPGIMDDPRVRAAIAAGVARTTARRWATTDDARLDKYARGARAA